MSEHNGRCLCGDVEVKITGDPVAMLVCHCKICRGWLAGAMNGAVLFKPEDVTVTKGAEKLRSFALSEGHDRSWCESCGGHVLTDHSNSLGVIDVYASVIEGFEFKPMAHVNYASRIMSVPDGLPKFVDFPADFGGSGEMMDE